MTTGNVAMAPIRLALIVVLTALLIGGAAQAQAPITFHLFAITDAARKQLKARLGKQVSVKAVKLFCAQTAWHIGDVAVPEWTLLGKP